jgi:L-malate glycosyltransferase
MEFKPIRILIIASWYKANDSKTEGSFIEEQARTLQNAGHNVTVIHPYLKGTFISTILDRKSDSSVVMDNDIQTIRIGVSPFLPKLRILSYKKLVRNTIKLLKDRSISCEFDLIHSHSLFMGGIVGYHLSRLWNVPLFHTEHTSGLIFKPNDYIYMDRLLMRRVYCHAKFVFCVSRFFREQLIRRYRISKKNIRVLPNLVNPIFFNPSDLPNGQYRVLVIGNFIEVKQHNLIIDAWKQINKNLHNALLTLIGEGPLQMELENKISKLNLNNSIVLVGRQSRENIKEHLKKSHLIVSCSKVETFGLSIAEAIAMGRPVVSTNSGGVLDIIDHKNGVVLNSNSSDELADCIERVLHNLQKYDSKSMSNKIKNSFGEEIIYKKLMSYYFK